jgi:hypothetical protein
MRRKFFSEVGKGFVNLSDSSLFVFLGFDWGQTRSVDEFFFVFPVFQVAKLSTALITGAGIGVNQGRISGGIG